MTITCISSLLSFRWQYAARCILFNIVAFEKTGFQILQNGDLHCLNSSSDSPHTPESQRFVTRFHFYAVQVLFVEGHKEPNASLCNTIGKLVLLYFYHHLNRGKTGYVCMSVLFPLATCNFGRKLSELVIPTLSFWLSIPF